MPTPWRVGNLLTINDDGYDDQPYFVQIWEGEGDNRRRVARIYGDDPRPVADAIVADHNGKLPQD